MFESFFSIFLVGAGRFSHHNFQDLQFIAVAGIAGRSVLIFCPPVETWFCLPRSTCSRLLSTRARSTPNPARRGQSINHLSRCVNKMIATSRHWSCSKGGMSTTTRWWTHKSEPCSTSSISALWNDCCHWPSFEIDARSFGKISMIGTPMSHVITVPQRM